MIRNVAFLLTAAMVVVGFLFVFTSALLPGIMWTEAIYTLACGIVYFLFPAMIPAAVVFYTEFREN